MDTDWLFSHDLYIGSEETSEPGELPAVEDSVACRQEVSACIERQEGEVMDN